MSIGSTRAICQSERMKNAPLSSIRNIIAYSDKLEQEGRSIIHLELGEPDFGTPAHIIDACKKALDNQEVHYGPIAGTVELRKALSRHCTRYGLEYAPEEILVSTGVVHGVFLSMLAYLDPGDEILVPRSRLSDLFCRPTYRAGQAGFLSAARRERLPARCGNA